jgi:integrase
LNTAISDVKRWFAFWWLERLGEVVGLNKADVDFEKCKIRIERSYNEKKHKLGQTKSGKPWDAWFDKGSLLDTWLRESVERFPESEVLFPTRTLRRG